MPSLSSQARRFSSVRSRSNSPELPPPLVRSLRVLPTAKVPKVPAARLPAVVVVAVADVVVVLAALVDPYVVSTDAFLPLITSANRYTGRRK